MTQAIIKFTDPWGWSKLDVFRNCKAQFKYQFMDKLPQPGNAAMKRGSDMHDTIEAYLQGWIAELPIGPLVDWKERFDELKSGKFTAEQAIGLDKNWMLLPNWFAPTTWVRAKMDANVLKEDHLTVIDFKSGQYRIPSPDQVELYSIIGHAIHPHVKSVTAELWFIDANDAYSQNYDASELVQLRKKYEQEAGHMYNTEVWGESPSRACKWCAYSKSKGGPCRY